MNATHCLLIVDAIGNIREWMKGLSETASVSRWRCRSAVEESAKARHACRHAGAAAEPHPWRRQEESQKPPASAGDCMTIPLAEVHSLFRKCGLNVLARLAMFLFSGVGGSAPTIAQFLI